MKLNRKRKNVHSFAWTKMNLSALTGEGRRNSTYRMVMTSDKENLTKLSIMNPVTSRLQTYAQKNFYNASIY